jgi:hypothetical protein
MARLFGRTASQFSVLLLALALVLVLACLFVPVTVVAFADTQAPPKAEQTPQQEQQPQQERHYTSIPNALTPLANSTAEEKLSAWERVEGSWALADTILCLSGLIEALVFIGAFFYRNRQGRPALFCLDFMLRVFVLCVALIMLMVTSIVSDMSGAMVVFDEMSLTILILFLIQQAVLVSAERHRKAVMLSRAARQHFRARLRYEGHISESHNKHA